jgi:hypothetical protein
VNPETFKAWKEKKLKEKEKEVEEKAKESKKVNNGRLFGLSGRELFKFQPSLFVDGLSFLFLCATNFFIDLSLSSVFVCLDDDATDATSYEVKEKSEEELKKEQEAQAQEEAEEIERRKALESQTSSEESSSSSNVVVSDETLYDEDDVPPE